MNPVTEIPLDLALFGDTLPPSISERKSWISTIYCRQEQLSKMRDGSRIGEV